MIISDCLKLTGSSIFPSISKSLKVVCRSSNSDVEKLLGFSSVLWPRVDIVAEAHYHYPCYLGK